MAGNDSKKLNEFLALLLLCGLFQFGFSIVVWGGLLFWAAGTMAWTRGWIHLALWVVALAVNFTVLLLKNREVLAARMKRQRNIEKSDKYIMALMLPVTLAFPVVAGLDAVRCQWSSLPVWSIYPGIVVHAAVNSLILWTMVVNPYLEKTVRVQNERGHQVVTTGPYAFVRHPMYVGVTFTLVSIPLVLGSWWTFVPVGLMALLLAVRTVFEERMLLRELPGYEEYTRSTPYRLVPGVW